MQEELQPEKSGVRICERHSFSYKVSVEEGGRGAPGSGTEISLQPMVKISW